MKKIAILLMTIIVVSAGLLSGCILRKPIVEGTGTIVYNDFEGGFYGIVSDFLIPGYPINHLDPINLPQEFKEDGLRVWFKVRLRPDLYSFHMWGIMVEILEINRL